MKERGIFTDEVEEVIREPETIKPSVKGRINALKVLNGRFVRVTFQDQNDYVLVITVVMRKKPFKERHHED